MAELRSTLSRFAAAIESRVDDVRYRIAGRRKNRKLSIVPYRGFGTSTELRVMGRVLVDKGILASSDDDSTWDNIRAMYHRFESDEVPDARVRVSFGRHASDATADEEGYFRISITPPEPLAQNKVWHEVDITLIAPETESDEPVCARGSVLVPPLDADYGVISDIDDTILVTNAATRFKMLRHTLLNNARTRLPFEGAAAFYRALHRGTKNGTNPIFYLSSSPWNLYDFLTDFMSVNHLPEGPLLLRDLGIDRNKLFKSSHESHKLSQIKDILSTYKHLPFVLIGDSGQHDPEIYRSAVEAFPGRIKTIYIRDVSDDVRDAAVRELGHAISESGGEMLLVPDTMAAAQHAVQSRYIEADALTEISMDRAADRGKTATTRPEVGSWTV